MDFDILYDGKWGACYDPMTRTMYCGYCKDGKTFNPTITITCLNEYEVPSVLFMCASLYSEDEVVNASYGDVLDDYYNAMDKCYYESISNQDRIS